MSIPRQSSPPKTLIDIRLRKTVESGSVEDLLNSFLKNKEAIPYLQQEMILRALTTFFFPLVKQHNGANQEELRQSLVDANYSWNLHFEYLQQKLNIDERGSGASKQKDSNVGTEDRSGFATNDEGTTNAQVPRLEADISEPSESDSSDSEFINIFQ